MRGTVIGSLRLDKFTVKTKNGYAVITLTQSEISAVKKEFGVEYAKEMIDREIDMDVAEHRIYAVPKEGASEKKKSTGVQCLGFRF